jgi:hypothetical protein
MIFSITRVCHYAERRVLFIVRLRVVVPTDQLEKLAGTNGLAYFAFIQDLKKFY